MIPYHENVIRNFANLEIKENGECIGWITVMEKCDEDLRKKLKEGTMTLDERKKAAIGVLEGLEYLEKVGIEHEDRKPENVLMKNGVAKWSDFGLIWERSGRRSYRRMGYAREGSKYRNNWSLCKFSFEIIFNLLRISNGDLKIMF